MKAFLLFVLALVFGIASVQPAEAVLFPRLAIRRQPIVVRQQFVVRQPIVVRQQVVAPALVAPNRGNAILAPSVSSDYFVPQVQQQIVVPQYQQQLQFRSFQSFSSPGCGAFLVR